MMGFLDVDSSSSVILVSMDAAKKGVRTGGGVEEYAPNRRSLCLRRRFVRSVGEENGRRVVSDFDQARWGTG